MDYFTLFKEKRVEYAYSHNDIGTARLFYDLHSAEICYVVEAKTWYTYDGRRWNKDEGGLYVMERCKDFAQAFAKYAGTIDDGGDESKAYIKYTSGFHTRRKREGLLSDAKSVSPMTIGQFDRNKYLLNLQDCTYDVYQDRFDHHSPRNYITKMANVKYNPGFVCKRWEQFVSEVMCGDADMARFLQKAFGYCLSGETFLECFFILYGSTTRNGKSTLTETIAHIMGDYARTAQPQSLARRPNDGAAVSPDIARLKGARFVNTPEPEKSLELNASLVKQLTGGDTYAARFLHENLFEFVPEFKLFINTNHLPSTSDNTIFTSGRVKLIPFERHFTAEEQDIGLKKLFKQPDNKSGILNWLIDGYRMLRKEGLILPEKVKTAIEDYSREQDYMAVFFAQTLVPMQDNRLKTSILFSLYNPWARDNGYKTLSDKEFMHELKARFFVKADYIKGNCVWHYDLKK